MILLGLIVGMIAGQFLLEQVNKLDLPVVNNIHNKTRALRPKKVIEYGLMLVVGMLTFALLSRVNPPILMRGIVVGLVWSVIVFCFEDTFFDNARNTLR